MKIGDCAMDDRGVEMVEKDQRQQRGARRLLIPDHQFVPTGSMSSGDHHKFTLPPPVRGRDQLQALLRRQWLHKRRGWRQSMVEIVSPLLLMALLVWGWLRSVEEHFQGEVFVNQTLPVSLNPNLLSDPESLLALCPPSLLARQRFSAEELGLLVALIREEVATHGLLGESAFRNLTRSFGANSNNVTPVSLLLADVSLKCVESAIQVSTVMKTFNAYNGPIPVPSFDAFVQAHKLIQRSLKSGNGQQYEDALRAQRMYGNLLGNLLQLGCITFAPDSPEVTALVEYLTNSTEFFKDLFGGIFLSEQEAEKFAMTSMEPERPTWAIIVVNHLDIEGGNVDYKIRMNFTTVPSTWDIVHKQRKGLLPFYKRYYTSGFLSLQDAINGYVLHRVSDQNQILMQKPMWGAPFPTPARTRNKFYHKVGPLLEIMLCLTTLYPLGMLVKGMVEDKESGAKQTMQIMGLKSWVFAVSWLIAYLAIFLVISICMTILLSMTLFPRSDPSLLFILYFLFTTSLISFGFFLSVFFSRSKLAAIVAPFVLFVGLMPRYLFFRTSNGQAIMGKTIASLLPPTAYAFGVDLLAHYEKSGYGLTWAFIGEDGFSMARVLILLVADSVLYILLAWYFEQVLPSEVGGRQPPWFLFSPSYWRTCTANEENSATYQKLNTTDTMDDIVEGEIEPLFTDGQEAAIQIQGLRKVFSDGKVAVSGLTLDFLEDHITALLGHNGAGKSTTISMLTGLMQPSSGDAKIWGRSILNNMNDIRRTIGLCSQQNVLFSYLTVKEHLQLYAAVKGVPKHALLLVVDDMVMSLGLKDKSETRAAYLSGGMQRKLQVGMAMIGGSRVVFLDEPTCGLDPQSRRSVWELLRSFKNGRAIVLTTHYMDEADILCDRIAIMSDGRLQCCGSSLFLKSRFGVGYNLSMTRSNPADREYSAVTELVKRHVPQAIPLSSAGGEISFQLQTTNKAAFVPLFQELEQNLDALHIGSYGISMTTLEEVFLRLADKDQSLLSKPDDNPSDVLKSNSKTRNALTVNMPLRRATYFSELKKRNRSFTRAFKQMFLKRAIIAKRDVKAFANSILLPVVAIGLVMLIMKLNLDPAGPQLQLNFGMYTSVVTGRKEGLSPMAIIPVAAGSATYSLPIQDESINVRFDQQRGINNSVQMSEQLLQTLYYVPARFGALVFNDTLWPRFNMSSLRELNLTQVKGEASTITNTNFSSQQGALERFGSTKDGNGLLSPVTLLFNTTSDHSFPALIQELAQVAFRTTTKNTSATLRMSSHPLPLTKNEALRVQTILTGLAALFTLIPLSYCAASFAVFVVQERVVKAKLLQMVSGASSFSYWAAAYAWDMLSYLAIVSSTMVVLLLYQDQSFTDSWAKASAAVALLIAYGLAVVPLTYCYSFAFSNHANAQVAIAGVHFITGFGMLGSNILMSTLENTKVLNEHLVLVYQLFPPYNLGRGLANLASLDLENTLRGGRASDPYLWDVTGCSLTLMLLEATVFVTLTLLIDSGSLLPCWLSCLRADPVPTSYTDSEIMQLREEDSDVGLERKRVEGGLASEDTVVVHQLRKVYPGQGLDGAKVAVKNLSLGIPPGQCFGFLGVNGAGKTTTLSILSGDVKPTSGDAFITGNSVLSELASSQKQIGYCPQFNPLLDLMTAREHLHLYASLKGVPSQTIAQVVTDLVEAVGLENHVDKVAGSYSGGNKRKLALSIALIGDPAVLFLDEPSSGMDPITRRAMWNLVANAVEEKHMSALLTTHSMEECEALCGRVGVMIAGSLVCLGSIQHIKSRFGQGYTVELQCSAESGAASLAKVHHFMTSKFPGALLEEEHMVRVKYSLSRTGLSLSHVFASLETAKQELQLEDYSVSQSTLEQVFLSFANGNNVVDYAAAAAAAAAPVFMDIEAATGN